MTDGFSTGGNSLADVATGPADASQRSPGAAAIQKHGPPPTSLGQHMRQCYDAQARRYREDDARQASEPDHLRLCAKLRRLCHQVKGPLQILDLGCGTGRYFHCLSKVHSLTAFDVSPAMLEQARNPVLLPQNSNHPTHLVCADFYVADLPPEQFHLVYCLGVFGNGCAFTPALAAKIFRALRPRGRLLFDAIDISFVPLLRRVRLRLRNQVHALLPARVKAAWDAQSGWLPPFIPTRGSLLSLMASAGFTHIELESQPAQLPSGPGRKFECIACKPG